MRHLFFTITLAAICVTACRTAHLAPTPGITWQLDSLPATLYLVDSAVTVKVLSAHAVQLIAGKGTDLHNPVSGAFRKNNAPKLLFQTSNDFDLWVKVSPQFKNRYDGGALMLYTDKANWAKILFQYTGTSYVLGMSVVTNHLTDDSYYPVVDSSSVYLRLRKKGNAGTFYTSSNAVDWSVTRQFVYKAAQPAVGFYAQSPVGPQCTVLFSNIHFEVLK